MTFKSLKAFNFFLTAFTDCWAEVSAQLGSSQGEMR